MGTFWLIVSPAFGCDEELAPCPMAACLIRADEEESDDILLILAGGV